jgi:ferredoxin
MATWRLTVNDECIGSGSCLGIAPKRFVLGEDDRSHPTSVLIEADETVLDAAASCPMEAISVRDAETGELIDP